MNRTILVRCFLVWLLFIPIAILNGAIREKILIPLLGQAPALSLSGMMLSCLFLLTVWALFPWLSISSSGQCWLVGILWVALTVSFELGFGHYIMGKPWGVLLEAYDVRIGNLWVLVLLVVLVSPRLAAKVRSVRNK